MSVLLGFMANDLCEGASQPNFAKNDCQRFRIDVKAVTCLGHILHFIYFSET